jgi:hypothetical protein
MLTATLYVFLPKITIPSRARVITFILEYWYKKLIQTTKNDFHKERAAILDIRIAAFHVKYYYWNEWIPDLQRSKYTNGR